MTQEFDLAAFLPKVADVIGGIESILLLAVMIGPLLMLGFGLIYLLVPPKEANYGLGFRCWWGMASLEAWQFTQHVAGLIWSGLGVALTIVMSLICNSFPGMAPMDMVWAAVWCMVAELILVGGACLAINIIVIRRFDRWGYRRDEEDPEEDDEAAA